MTYALDCTKPAALTVDRVRLFQVVRGRRRSSPSTSSPTRPRTSTRSAATSRASISAASCERRGARHDRGRPRAGQSEAPDIVTMSGVRFAWPGPQGVLARDRRLRASGSASACCSSGRRGRENRRSSACWPASSRRPRGGSTCSAPTWADFRARRAIASAPSTSASSSRCSTCCPMARSSTTCCCR